jgi:hypothetical protein
MSTETVEVKVEARLAQNRESVFAVLHFVRDGAEVFASGKSVNKEALAKGTDNVVANALEATYRYSIANAVTTNKIDATDEIMFLKGVQSVDLRALVAQIRAMLAS